jgi:hypothetical protein
VWIEDRAGAIVRGHAESVSRGGAAVLLPEIPAFTPGDDVALRIAFERGAPTVAAGARVRSVVETADGSALCAVEWTASVPALESWLTRAA